MTHVDDNRHPDNRERKVDGRSKRKRFRAGSRAYLHAVTNSIAARGRVGKPREIDDKDRPRISR